MRMCKDNSEGVRCATGETPMSCAPEKADSAPGRYGRWPARRVRWVSRVGETSEIVDRRGPVAFEQARQRPIGKQAAVCLARRTVVAFVGRVDDPLYRLAAHRARQP